MSEENESIRMSVNTAQPTNLIDTLTAQPNHGRVLTETIQPQGPSNGAIPPLISGVSPSSNPPTVQPAPPAAAPEPSSAGAE